MIRYPVPSQRVQTRRRRGVETAQYLLVLGASSNDAAGDGWCGLATRTG